MDIREVSSAEFSPQITAFDLGHSDGWDIIESPATRPWMDKTHDKFAYRCLPLRHANEMAYWLTLPVDIEVEWNGGNKATDLRISHLPPSNKGPAASHFGYGILTFKIPWLFKTNINGIGLRVSGPANKAHPNGMFPLEGLVETWEQNNTFTMNWQVYTPLRKLKIPKGYPVCAISLYNWWNYKVGLKLDSIDNLNVDDRQKFEAWRKHRKSVLDGEPIDDSRNHYTKGVTVEGEKHKCPHWIKLRSEPKNNTPDEVPDVIHGHDFRTFKTKEP